MNNSNSIRASRLLIVDDNRAIHEDFRKVLSPRRNASNKFESVEAELFGDGPAEVPPGPECFQMDSAYQGNDALEMVKQSLKLGKPYSMAFVDVRMPPGWDGIETTAKIWEVDPDLQVVICTAYSDCSWDEMLDKLGRSDRLVILKKPFDNVEVQQLANSLSRKWQLLQESKNKMASLEEMVVDRTAQMVREQEKFKVIFENSPEGIFQTTPEGQLVTANAALAGIYGYESPKALMAELTDIHQLYVNPERRTEFHTRLQTESIVREFVSEIKCKDGSRKWISETACKAIKLDGSVLHYQGFVIDISQQRKAQNERDVMEVNLRQSQKLEAVGHLAAGMAHEINTPIQYIGDNIRFIEDSFAGVHQLLRDCQKLSAATESNTVTPELIAAVESSCQKADINYLCNEIPNAVRESLDGVHHVAKLVRAMKEFSHPGSREKSDVDLNRAIETTVTVARSEWKYVAEVVMDFAPEMPLVPCLPAEFNQVILNLIVNAAHAVADVVKKEEGTKGVIKISTRLEGSWAVIRISDTGNGIPEAIQHRIFEPFFTTKPVGQGTGQGLAIARSIVADKHGGQLSFESNHGKGTMFTIRLPISRPSIAQNNNTQKSKEHSASPTAGVLSLKSRPEASVAPGQIPIALPGALLVP